MLDSGRPHNYSKIISFWIKYDENDETELWIDNGKRQNFTFNKKLQTSSLKYIINNFETIISEDNECHEIKFALEASDAKRVTLLRVYIDIFMMEILSI